MTANPLAIAFTVYAPVASQGSMTALRSRSTGKVIVKHPKKLKPWRDTVGYSAQRAMAGRAKLIGPLALYVRFTLPRPKSAPKSRTWPHVKPDLDKMLRAIGDAMEGIVYANDSQIVVVAASKTYGERVGVEIKVEAMERQVAKAVSSLPSFDQLMSLHCGAVAGG